MARPQTTPEQVAVLRVVGANIRRHRLAQEIAQDTLGKKFGGDRQYVHSVEQGEVNVSTTRIVDFARALGIPISDLFVGVE